MMRAACFGLWLAVSVSVIGTAGIIGVPLGIVLLEVIQATIWIGLAIGAFMLGRTLLQEWQGTDNNESSA